MNEIDMTNEERLQTLATRINTIKSTTQQIMMQASIEIGKCLVEAKAAVGHGNWETWLSENVEYSQRTASNLIKVYQEYGVGQQKLFGKDINPQTLAALTYTQAIALLGIKNPEERAEFVEKHNVEEMSTRELEKAIKERDEAKAEWKSAADERDRRIKELDESEQAKKAALGGKRDAEAKLMVERAARHKIEEQLKELQEKPAGGVVDDKRAQELEVKLAVAAGKIKELELKLEEPVEAAAVIPPEMQEELERLRAEVSNQKSGKAERFATLFDIYSQTVNKMLDIIREMDEAEKERYCGAMKKIVAATQKQIGVIA